MQESRKCRGKSTRKDEGEHELEGGGRALSIRGKQEVVEREVVRKIEEGREWRKEQAELRMGTAVKWWEDEKLGKLKVIWKE